MKSQARVVIIGGGVVGVSTLYHLVKKGWSDVVLIEKMELTHGSTWHAAGLLPLFNMSYSVGQIHKYSVDLYKSLEEETGQNVSFHQTGNLRLATNRDRMDEYYKYCGTANTIGVPFELITPKQVKELWPLCNTEGLVGALYHPQDGHVAPADVTMALAKGARTGGAEIYRQTKVTGIEQLPSGEWKVKTDKGDIACEHVVTATGSWARQVGKMVGLDLPVIAVEHQYLITEEIPELVERKRQGLPEMAVLRESDASYYMREERQGLILGPYEKGAPAWAVDGVSEDFGQELLAPDLERLEPHIEAAINRVPVFGTAGIKDCINGPIPYTPDGSPLIGPAWGLKNFWLNEGHSFGITAAGGSGWQLAEWIVEGEPGIDMWDVDARRFGDYANKNYTKIKNEETYEHVFIVHYPLEERPAARPAKTAPCYDRLKSLGAVFGQRFGWERANWFAP
ncbi:MAG: FAD-dependent oxidoreductase, partial [Dongiaceae bacterium]